MTILDQKNAGVQSGAKTGNGGNEKPLLSEPIRHQILYDWNETSEKFPDVCVHQLFEQQVVRNPDAVAVVFQDRQLTYRELNQRSNQVAHYLRKRGVGPEVLVGVCLERSPEMVAGLLGVWKAGGAYVPIDPTYPPERLSFMVSDADVRVLLTEQKCKPLFPSAADRAVCLDSDWPAIAQESASNPDSGATPANLAYVIYTSGSTGKPKGAMILHRGLVNYLCWAIKAYGVKAGGSVPVHSSISFDLTVTSLYPALLAGGQVEMLPEDVGAQNLLAALRQAKNRSLVKITPAHLELLSQQLSPEEAAGMTKTFVVGGENLLAESLRLWREFAPATRLINEYGPTETVVGCCVYEVQPEDPSNGPVPIGRPIANTQLYVLDENLKPLPTGVTGELYIGGAGVARGYLNRPELTQERFLPDPFSSEHAARLYKTGDLARYRQDGILECLGRADNQVKIRGYRIELGEIEATLASYPTVQSCAVLAREDEPGNKQLVGYVVVRQNESPSAEELREFVGQKLPEYMAPARFVFLESLPLTPNGKVDRKALPAPSTDPAATWTFVAPRTETEKKLAAIWSELLKVERVGIHDDFFGLGGHSLMAIKAGSQIRDYFDVDLPMEALFDNPTIAGLAQLLPADQGEGEGIQKIAARKQSGPSPLSFAQERLWFLDQLTAGSPVYNVIDAIPFSGEYKADAMKRAVNELVRRQESLRTAFVSRDGQPMQVVLPSLDLALSEVDLTSWPESEREREWMRVIAQDGRKAFDLSQAPLIRATIVHLTPHQHKLLLTIHHIIADEWSMEVMHRELTQIYEAFSQGRPSPLPELRIQYSDYACWQRDRLQGEVLQKQISYWKKELAGVPVVLELPTDKPRPAVQSFRGATELFRLPRKLLEQMKSIGRQEQATLFMTLGAGFMALLHRYTGQDDILVGTPISGRTRSETENLVGCFLNTVVLRSQITGQLSFRSLLQKVRERALGAYDQPDLPFEQLVAELAPQRDLSHSPLFQVMFVLHDPGGVSEVARVSGSQALANGTSKFDLTLLMSETEDGLEALIEYSTDLFEADTIRRMGGHFRTLLEAIAQSPEQSLSTLPMLPAAERQQLLVDWNNTAVAYPKTAPGLHQLIEEQAGRTPEQVALVFEQQRMTYAELNQCANQLAHHLRGRGVGPDVLVGLFLERSPEMLVGVLGILKAGGAYVPMDPAYPKERLGYILEDSKAPLVVTQKSLLDRLPGFAGQSICLDDDADWAGIAGESTENPSVQVKPEHLAYVLFTSGSTGRPKGVALEHRSATNFVQWARQVFSLQELAGVLFSTSVCFDLSVYEIFVTLSAGGKLIIAPNALYLPTLAAKDEVTLINTVPSALAELLRTNGIPPSVKTVNLAGEALPETLVEQTYATTQVDRVYNLYGPTETTTYSTYTPVRRGLPVTIGRPLANTRCYILDARRNPLPVGVAGEMYIAGSGLARGYYGRPDLTNERFVLDPFSPEGGARMYRTSDLCRWLPDGNIEYLGRMDHQVKLRGFRIELGEIETILDRHPAVRQSVLMVREDEPGSRQLVAYVVPAVDGGSQAPPRTEDLRQYVKEHLPEFMVPSAVVVLDALPLTPNRKIDRKALPAPAQSVAVDHGFVAPRDSIEQSLAQIWAKILNLRRVGIHDNFFELGGHSLLAVRIIVEVEKFSKIRLPLATLLQAPTIADLAEILRRRNWTPSWSSLVPIRPGGSKPPLFLMHSHGGNVLEYYPLANLLDADQPVYALQARGLDGRIVKDSSVEEMASAYIKELRSLRPDGPYYIGGFCFGGLVALEVAQQLTAAGQEVALLVMIQSMHPDAMRFKPDTTVFDRWRFRTSKRMSLELENLSSRGLGYVAERLRRVWDLGRARTAIKLDNWSGTHHPDLSSRRMHYILEILAMEHGKVITKYAPRPYRGDVLLFRASKQLSGLVADESLGWKHILQGNLDVCEIPGHQQNLLLESHVSRLAKELSSRMKAAQQR
jgi:amino acid adenylation domain-containing protein